MSALDTKSESSLRKAAVLVRSLDPEAVAALLARLSPAEAKAVRLAVRELDQVSEEDRLMVAEDLRRSATAPQHIAEPEPTHAPAAIDTDSPLAGLNHAPADTIASFLAIEQPATVAVVLSCLAPARAGEVLNHLPDALQASTVERLVDLGEIDTESLHVIAAELEAWITKQAQENHRKQDRKKTLHAILAASSPLVRRRLAARLGGEPRASDPAPPPAPQADYQRNPPCEAEPPSPAPPSVAKPRLRFSALHSLPAHQLAAAIGGIDHNTLVLALTGATDELMNRLRSLATRKQMKQLEKSIAQVGPVRLSDIEHAQRLLAERVESLVLGGGVA